MRTHRRRDVVGPSNPPSVAPTFQAELDRPAPDAELDEIRPDAVAGGFRSELHLLAVVEKAYERARREVFDLPFLGPADLSAAQREALTDLESAEAELRTFRARRIQALGSTEGSRGDQLPPSASARPLDQA